MPNTQRNKQQTEQENFFQAMNEKMGSNFNWQESMAPFAKSCEMMWQMQQKWANTMYKMSSLNQEFCQNMMREVQNNIPSADQLKSPSNQSMNADSWKECMAHAVRYSEQCTELWQECCGDLSSQVKDQYTDAMNKGADIVNKGADMAKKASAWSVKK